MYKGFRWLEKRNNIFSALLAEDAVNDHTPSFVSYLPVFLLPPSQVHSPSFSQSSGRVAVHTPSESAKVVSTVSEIDTTQ